MRAHELARSHQIVAFTRLVTLQIRTRWGGGPILVPFVNTTRIFVGAGYTGANGNYYWGLHEFSDMAFVLHYLRQDDLFVDVGANIGSYTLLASGAVGTRTIAFEPVPQTLVRFRANCDANGIGSRVDMRAVCVGASAGDVTFSTDADTMNSIVSDGDMRTTIQVPLRRLDDEIDEPPALIKIDAEGFDDDALAGAVKLLGRQGPLVLLVETLGGGAFGRDKNQSEKRLEKLGFVRCKYNARTRVVEPTSAAPENNYLFVRDITFAQLRVASARSYDVNAFGRI
jgi:FkbM family methyltransferase